MVFDGLALFVTLGASYVPEVDDNVWFKDDLVMVDEVIELCKVKLELPVEIPDVERTQINAYNYVMTKFSSPPNPVLEPSLETPLPPPTVTFPTSHPRVVSFLS
jgi:hypothetical protein